MITEETYLEMKKLIADYELEQLNKNTDITNIELPYLEIATIKINRKYNKNYGDEKVCQCGHSYYRHFDSYDKMEDVGCKYCNCCNFQEPPLLLREVAIKEIGKRYYWNRHPLGGKAGNVTIVSEGGSNRVKGWQVLYGNETEGTKFANDDELFEEIVE